MTNVLAIPLAQVDVTVGNNEDWVDSITYRVGGGAPDPDADLTTLPQLDLRGIEFEMEVRRKAADHEVILNASTKNKRMAVGAFPNVGYLLIAVSVDEMKTKTAGAYVADVVARDDKYERKIIEMALTIVEGITR